MTEGCGTIFRITPAGALTAIYNFCSQTHCEDGHYPSGEMALGSDGSFYGQTAFGGADGYATLFKITPEGALTTLYTLTCSSDLGGEYTVNGIVQGTNGNFYGTAPEGGNSSSECTYITDGTCGTAFELSTALRPFVEILPTSGKVGAQIRILGTDLTGTTSVSFNGTAAAFKVISPTLISTTVSTGATTGKVKVTTPSGTLVSKVGFHVIP